MKSITININDDTKLDILLNLLREINFVDINEDLSAVSKNKKMGKIPLPILNPVNADNFKIFRRDELYDRENIH
ncbi:MAG: hypothetical protein HQK63_04195 [Desulfamplus sp.]|nr:hypothetical protein [Desulfamplus sp.]